MSKTISLSDCQLQIWRPSSSKNIALESLVFSFSLNGDMITIKQYSELDPTESFVAYTLKTSDCTYLSSEYLSADVRIIYLRLERPVAATIRVNDRVNAQAIAGEVATLEMCPMMDIRLQNGCKIDLIIPYASLHTNSISQLLELFGDGTKKEKILTDQVQFPTMIQKDKPRPKSVTLSNDDFEYLEASAKRSQAINTNTKLNYDRFDQSRGSKHDQPSRQRKLPSFLPTSNEIPDLARGTGEEFLADTWAKRQETFAQITPKSRQNASTLQSVGLDSKAQAMQDPRAQWVDFANLRGTPHTTTKQGDRAFGGSVPDSKETEGYLQDPSGDYSRPDDRQIPTRNIPATHRPRGRGRFKAASFIPRTNASIKRPEPKW